MDLKLQNGILIRLTFHNFEVERIFLAALRQYVTTMRRDSSGDRYIHCILRMTSVSGHRVATTDTSER